MKGFFDKNGVAPKKTLNYAGCTLTFALAGNIDLVTRGEYVCLYEIAYIVSVCVSKTDVYKRQVQSEHSLYATVRKPHRTQ